MVGGECVGFNEDDGVFGGGLVEVDYYQVKVYVQGVYGYYFVGQCVDDVGQLFVYQVVIVQLLGVVGEVVFDGQVGLFVYDFLDGCMCVMWLQVQ